ncbi:MAG: Rpn family recombination-promoting nuclease/putative transposase [Marinobacterium sp.]|nr:Rpn family recombination-promoting nuclease/putative transposase [Marinobacterium sp.]
MKDKYINLFTDFGFKKIFGEETSKAHLISFLNTLLPAHHQISELEFSQHEHQGATALDRKAIFDLYCTSSTGEFFIVELQKAKQNFFRDRSVFYATFPIQQQAQRGEWNFRLSAVYTYTIGILDFIFDDEDSACVNDVVHRVQLKNQHNQVFYDKLTFIYLTLPNFTKTEDELETLQDKWFFLFRHLHELDQIPPRLREKVFLSLFEKASIAKFQPAERQAYESSLKYYRDLKNVIDTAHDEGREEGRAEGIAEGIAKGRAEGIEEGIKKGERQAERKMISTLLENGMAPEAVAVALKIPLLAVLEISQKTSSA